MLQTEPCTPGYAGRPCYDVVIPCYNRARTVERAVNSVLAQAFLPERVILVDDGSSDGTARVLLEFERFNPMIQALLLPRNVGASSARNVGLALARSEWVSFLDSDDVWMPGAAEALLSTAHESDIIVGHFRRAWPDGELGEAECGWDGEDVLSALALTGAIGPSWSLVRRSFAALVGGFDPSFRNCNDWDFFVRVAAEGARFARTDATVALYHVAAANRLSHDQELGAANARRVQAHPLLRRLLDADIEMSGRHGRESVSSETA